MMGEKAPYDPKLRQAAAEIRQIMAKYDIGGSVVLHSKTHGEFLNLIPRWSTIRPQGNRVLRIKLPVKSDPELADATAGFWLGQRDVLLMLTEQYFVVAEAIEKAIAKHGGDIDHTPLNNLVTRAEEPSDELRGKN